MFTALQSPHRRFLHLFLSTALVAALAVALPVMTAPAALAVGGSTPATAVPVTSIPYNGGDSFGGVGVAPAIDTANMAVATACNGGTAYSRPNWFKYTTPTARTISATASAAISYARDTSDYIAGIAVLDASLRVIDCDTASGRAAVGPISLAAGATIYVVQFTGPADCLEDLCFYDYYTSISIGATTAWNFPANDNWRDAIAVTSLPLVQTVDATFATEEGPDYEGYAAPANACSSLPDHLSGSVWWRFTPSTTGRLPIFGNGTFSTVVSYAKLGPNGPEYLPFECPDGTTPPDPIFQAGTTYLIAVGTARGWYNHQSGGVGPVTLSIGTGLTLKKPDLVVTKVTTTPSAPKAGDPVQFTATIKNQGAVATTNGVTHGVLFKVGGVSTSFSDTFNASLAPGASVTLTANNGPAGVATWPATAGSKTVQAIVDDVNRIPGETSETNNTLSLPFTVAAGPARPDLVVTAVTWTPANPATGAAVKFSATIKNQGSAATTAGVVNGVRFSVDGITKNWSDTYKTSLAAGASVTLTANSGPTGAATWPATAGPHTITALVDDVNRIPESNDSNNTKTAQMAIGTINPRADLVVTNITWSPPSLLANTPARFSATVKNIGTRSVQRGTVVGVSFRINGLAAGATFSDTSSGQLLPGESVTVTANGGGTTGAWKPTAVGTVNVTAIVDDVNRIPESNESNNQLVNVLKVG